MKRFLLLITASLMFCGAVSARKVSGSVKAEEEKLAGVIVTDGVNFTLTGKNGKFEFDIDDEAEFVYIITPSCFTARYSYGVPQFYIRAEGRRRFDFELVRISDTEAYSVVAVADTQFADQEQFDKFRGAPMDDLIRTTHSLSSERFTVGFALGDICWDNLPLLDDYKKEIVRTEIPFYPVIGNHDHDLSAVGDIAASGVYRSKFGPENYAVWVGKDLVIALDAIIYDTAQKYKEGYAEHVLAWVEGLMKHIPEDTGIYVVQHSQMMTYYNGNKIINADRLLALFGKRDVNVVSGHTHIHNNMQVTENVYEHNIGTFCGSLWSMSYCFDGTPGGYKVFTKENGKLEWYYKSIGHDKDFQFEIFNIGQCLRHPNSVIVHIWDFDPEWKMTWYEDGRFMGDMEKTVEISPFHILEYHASEAPDWQTPGLNNHYFSATPDPYAENVTIVIESRFGTKWTYDIDLTQVVDVQAHRGGMALMPENTLEAMRNSVDLGVNTLEMDLAVSADGKVLLSHDLMFHHRYATRPDGTSVNRGDTPEYIYTMPYDSVKKYDVGMKYNAAWPVKQCIPAVKPLLADVITFVESYTSQNGLSPVKYNIEIKSDFGEGEGKNWPEYKEFVDVCASVLASFNLGNRLIVQSFDHRALNYLHDKYPDFILSYLIRNTDVDFDRFMGLLDFTPEWLSPPHEIINAEFMNEARRRGMMVVTWTVDEPEEFRRLIELKVDGIITNHPDRLLDHTRGYVKVERPAKL